MMFTFRKHHPPRSRAAPSGAVSARAGRRERNFGRCAPCAHQGSPAWLAARGGLGAASQAQARLDAAPAPFRLPSPGGLCPLFRLRARRAVLGCACGPAALGPPLCGVKIGLMESAAPPPFRRPDSLRSPGFGRPGASLVFILRVVAALPRYGVRAVRISPFGRAAHDALPPKAGGRGPLRVLGARGFAPHLGIGPGGPTARRAPFGRLLAALRVAGWLPPRQSVPPRGGSVLPGIVATVAALPATRPTLAAARRPLRGRQHRRRGSPSQLLRCAAFGLARPSASHDHIFRSVFFGSRSGNSSIS